MSAGVLDDDDGAFLMKLMALVFFIMFGCFPTYTFALHCLADGMNPGASLRHILKIKRFLGTLLHFGCEISHDVGERVRNLVFNLVVSLKRCNIFILFNNGT